MRGLGLRVHFGINRVKVDSVRLDQIRLDQIRLDQIRPVINLDIGEMHEWEESLNAKTHPQGSPTVGNYYENCKQIVNM